MGKDPNAPPARRLPRGAGKRLRFELPAIGSTVDHALLITKFVDDVRAVMKDDWPASTTPDVQVNTYAIDPIGQCIQSSPLPKYLSELTISSEGLSKQCQDSTAGTREWVFVRL